MKRTKAHLAAPRTRLLREDRRGRIPASAKKTEITQLRQRQPDDTFDKVRIGIRIKHARLAKGYTLKELADVVECSESMISKVENDKLRPSIYMLHRLARALGTNIALLFSEHELSNEPVHIVRADQRPTFHVDPEWQGEGVWLERVIPPTKGALLQANVLNLSPNGRSDGVIAHTGEELGFVITGRLELDVDGVVYVLNAGDSFFFASSMAHGYRNTGDRLARILWVNTPPSF
jgi:transcriptional regulator with XRE-family HTH domain